MGVQITDLLKKEEISLKKLIGKVVAVDAHLFLYQFLTTIRQRDGTPLMDSKGNITSHLVGLFTRTTKLMRKGIKLCYVFDGDSPELKRTEQKTRRERKEKARKKYEEAKEEEDVEAMKKYASRTSVLTKQMINEAKELINCLGLPIIQAPAEGEAQAAHLVKEEKAYCVASQDADSLLFGTPRLVRNISIAGKRKKTNKLAYETVSPELITLSETLNGLGIDQKQLIALGVLVGTDYNPGGVKGIGPKTALKMVKKHKDLDKLFKEAKWKEHFDIDWKEAYNLFTDMPVTDKFELNWNEVDKDKIMDLLVDKHDFSEERTMKSIKKLIKEKGKLEQKGLNDFLG